MHHSRSTLLMLAFLVVGFAQSLTAQDAAQVAEPEPANTDNKEPATPESVPATSQRSTSKPAAADAAGSRVIIIETSPNAERSDVIRRVVEALEKTGQLKRAQSELGATSTEYLAILSPHRDLPYERMVGLIEALKSLAISRAKFVNHDPTEIDTSVVIQCPAEVTWRRVREITETLEKLGDFKVAVQVAANEDTEKAAPVAAEAAGAVRSVDSEIPATKITIYLSGTNSEAVRKTNDFARYVASRTGVSVADWTPNSIDRNKPLITLACYSEPDLKRIIALVNGIRSLGVPDVGLLFRLDADSKRSDQLIIETPALLDQAELKPLWDYLKAQPDFEMLAPAGNVIQAATKVLDREGSLQPPNSRPGGFGVSPFGGGRSGIPPAQQPGTGDPKPTGNKDAVSFSIENSRDSVDELRERQVSLDRNSLELAARLREPLPDPATGDKLKSELRQAVREAFETRQKLQRAELAEFAQRLQGIQQSIEMRDKISEQIIDRRVEELLDPNLKWEEADANSGRAQALRSSAADDLPNETPDGSRRSANQPSVPTQGVLGKSPQEFNDLLAQETGACNAVEANLGRWEEARSKGKGGEQADAMIQSLQQELGKHKRRLTFAVQEYLEQINLLEAVLQRDRARLAQADEAMQQIEALRKESLSTVTELRERELQRQEARVSLQRSESLLKLYRQAGEGFVPSSDESESTSDANSSEPSRNPVSMQAIMFDMDAELMTDFPAGTLQHRALTDLGKDYKKLIDEGRLTIVSRPQMRTQLGQPGTVQIGMRMAVLSPDTSETTQLDVGETLQITPREEDGALVLDIKFTSERPLKAAVQTAADIVLQSNTYSFRVPMKEYEGCGVLLGPFTLPNQKLRCVHLVVNRDDAPPKMVPMPESGRVAPIEFSDDVRGPDDSLRGAASDAQPTLGTTLNQLQGKWRLTSQVADDGDESITPSNATWEFNGNRVIARDSGGGGAMIVTIDESHSPVHVDVEIETEEETGLGLLSIDGDLLKICLGKSQKEPDPRSRPEKLEAVRGAWYMELWRMKPGESIEPSRPLKRPPGISGETPNADSEVVDPSSRVENASTNLTLAEICSQAHAALTSIETLQYRFEKKDDQGWQSHAEFYADHIRFRVNRKDVTGIMSLDEDLNPIRNPPMTISSAFDGQKQQYARQNEPVRVKRGREGGAYGITIPQIWAYGWLRNGAAEFHWDTILSKELWEQRFQDAIYIGNVTEDGRRFEIVDFPQRLEHVTPCIYRVYFARDLAFLPLKIFRNTLNRNEPSTTVHVTRFKTFTVKGKQIAIPLDIQHRETQADGVSHKGEATITVDESSLKVNYPLDDSLFTLNDVNEPSTAIE